MCLAKYFLVRRRGSRGCAINPLTPKIWLVILLSGCYSFPWTLFKRIWGYIKITSSSLYIYFTFTPKIWLVILLSGCYSFPWTLFKRIWGYIKITSSSLYIYLFSSPLCRTKYWYCKEITCRSLLGVKGLYLLDSRPFPVKTKMNLWPHSMK